MDLINHTPYRALLMRFGASNDTMGSALTARVTYGLADGQLVVADEQAWPVSPKPWQCEYGAMEADEVFYKGGTDVLVFGSARAPKRRPVSQMMVTIEVGHARSDLAVFGERAWLPRAHGVVASAPQPFVEMPLTMANAYGGSCEWDGLRVPFADNPDGKGFMLEFEQAPGRRLPNIEDPRQLITRWDDRPSPVGVGICPPAHSGRLRKGVIFGKKGTMKAIHPCLFNAAFPEMVFQGVHPGTVVRLTGVSHDDAVSFLLPKTPMVFRLTLDRTEAVRTPSIDQVGIEVDKKRVFITYRYAFRYVLYERQQRRAELLMARGG